MVNSNDATMGDVTQRVEREGFAIVPECLEKETLRRLAEEPADGLGS
jgi:hypothetical protein